MKAEAILKLSNLPPFIVVDPDGVVQFYNEPATSKASPYLKSELMAGCSVYRLFGDQTIERLQESLAQALQGQTSTFLYPAHLPESVAAYEITCEPYTEETDGFKGVCLTINTTNHQKAEQEGEMLYRTLAESFPNGTIYLVNKDMRYISADGEGLSHAGLPREKIVGRLVREVIPPRAHLDIEAFYRQALEGKVTEEQELSFANVHYKMTVLPVRNTHGEIYAAMGVTWDVSQRKETELALKAFELKIRTAIESIAELFFIVGTDYKIQLFNKRAAFIIEQGAGITVSEGTYYPDVLPEKAKSNFYESFPRALNGEYVNEEVLMNSTDEIEQWGEVRYAPVVNESDQVEAVCITMLNISPRKRNEKALRTSEARMRAILDNLQQAFYLIDSNFQIKLFNRRAADLVRNTVKFELTENQDFRQFVEERNLSDFYQCFSRTLAGEYIDQELKIEAKSGKNFWTEVHYTAVIEDSGLTTGVCINIMDITSRKTAEEALIISENRLRATIDNLQQSFFLLDLDHRIELFNTRAAILTKRLLGVSLEEGLDFFSIGLAYHSYTDVYQNFAAASIGEFKVIEKELYSKDGEQYWVELRFHPVRDDYDHVTGVCITMLDITSRKQADQELETSRTRLNTLMNNIRQSFFLLEKDGTLLLFNDIADRYFKNAYHQTLEIGRLFQDQLAGEFHDYFSKALEATRSGQTIKMEVLLPDFSGGKFWSEIVGNPVFDENGEINTVCFTTSDISERKMSEEALKESEERYRLLAENSTDLILKVKAGGTILFASSSCYTILGYRPEELVGSSTYDLIRKEDQTEGIAIFKKALAAHESSYTITDNMLHKDGRWIPVESSNTIIYNPVTGEFIETLSAIRDITERKLAEQALKQSEERFARIIHTAPIPITMTYNGFFTEVNKTFERVSGYSREEIIGKSAAEVLRMNPQDIETMVTTVRREGIVSDLEVTNYDRWGNQRHIFLSMVPIEIQGETHMLSTSFDITARKKAEQALRSSEARLRSIMDNSPQFYILLDNDFRLLAFNRHVAEFYFNMHGIRGEIGQPVINFLPLENQDFLLNSLIKARAGENLTIEFNNTLENGASYEWEAWVSPVREVDGSISGICIVQSDITRRKQDEQKLKAALAEKEVLLKEIHHRVKNNLQIISSLLKLQGNSIQEPEALNVLKDSQQRIRSIALIHEMLYQTGNLSQVDFGEYLNSLANQSLRTYRKGNVELLHTAPKGLWLGLDQAIPCGLIMSELITNALKYAFPKEYNRQAIIKLDIQADPGNKELILVIADNGIGFPKGLDLSRTETLGYQLVEMLSRQLDGQLNIESSQDSGTRVELKFTIKN